MSCAPNWGSQGHQSRFEVFSRSPARRKVRLVEALRFFWSRRRSRCFFRRHLCPLLSAVLLPSFGLTVDSSAVAAGPSPEIWISPNGDTPDLLDMFTRPDQWSQARSRISVFAFGPPQIMGKNQSGMNTSTDLAGVRAFQLLRSWGIRTAIGAPALKEWDCSGELETKRTLQYISVVEHEGGTVDLLDIDEPLIGGIQHCHDTMKEVIRKTSVYMARIRGSRPSLAIGITEAYPTFSPSEIVEFVTGLSEQSATPAFLQLDVNIPVLPLRRESHLEQDLRSLQTFFRQRHIPFGVIIWSGYNPVHSDHAYYDNSMAWVKRVHAAIGTPDQLFYASWVTRSSQRCVEGRKDCTTQVPNCAPDDPAYCGKRSVPLNLPDTDTSRYSLTRLVLDGLHVFEQH